MYFLTRSEPGVSRIATLMVAIPMAAASIFGANAPPEAPPQGGSLAALSLEELTRVEVSSVSRKDQKLLKVPAAVFVVTADDIRRSGVTSVPDALRMVPGVEVAQITSSVWAVSARGFNGRSANKILVLVDGRSVYNALYSGTLWNQHQVPLENIERIEVVRGPGATMWGANAVDGVISIITKKARDTQGFMVSTEVGQNDLPDSAIRFGGHRGDNLQFRLDARFAEHRGLLLPNGAAGADRWSAGQGGARVDWRISDRDSLTVDGEVYSGGGWQQTNRAYPLPSPFIDVINADFKGGFARARWEHKLSKSDFALGASYTREAGAEWVTGVALSTIDVDFQHNIRAGSRHEVVWGGGCRFRDDHLTSLVLHPNYTEGLYSAFVQDEITLVPSRLSLTGGVKFQHFRNTSANNSEVQPQVRLLWTPGRVSSVWTSVSRAVRTPSQLERDFNFSFALPQQNGLPVNGLLQGNPNLPGEVVVAYEAGYRRQISKRVTLDVASFYNHYSRLIGAVAETPYLVLAPGPSIIVPQTYMGKSRANTRGLELAVSYSPRRNWRLQAGFAHTAADFLAPPTVALIQPPGALWATPAHTASVRSTWDVTRRWALDTSVYAASAISDQGVPGYARVDLRGARKFGEGGEISVGIRNLFDEKHLEFRPEDYLIASYLRRNVFAGILWRF